jgi:choline-glycine betaine transporter
MSVPCFAALVTPAFAHGAWQLFIGAQNVWVFFVAYLWLTPEYHAMKLGSPTEVPEFSSVTWLYLSSLAFLQTEEHHVCTVTVP